MKNQFTVHSRVSNTITDVNALLNIWLVILGIVLTGDAYSDESEKSGATGVSLRVKPVLCIIDERQPDCEMTFQVEWEAGQQNDYCLEDDVSLSPLNCWVRESSGEFDEARIVKESFKYQLTRSGQAQPLAEAKVELMTIDNSDRRRNRRSRHAWSIL